MAKTKDSGIGSPQGSPIPKGFRGYTEQWMADNATASKLSDKQLDELRDMVGETFKNGEVYSFVTPDAITDVANGGNFKSVIEMGNYDAEYEADRRDVASKLFGIDGKSMRASDFEKYGMLGSSDEDKFFSSGTTATIYGDVCVKFKKSGIENKATYTFDDSYNMVAGHNVSVIAGGLGKNLSASGIPVADMSRAYKKMKSIKDSGGKLDATDVTKSAIGKYAYIEVQLHGNISASDIDTVYIKGKKSGKGYSMSKENEAAYDALKKAGIKTVVRSW